MEAEAAQTEKARARWRRWALAAFALFGLVGVALLWIQFPRAQDWVGLLGEVRTFLEVRPWALVLVLATLPGIGFPISPVLALFGIVLVPSLGLPLTLLIAFLAQGVCTLWTFLLASGPLRGWLQGMLRRHNRLPVPNTRSAVKLGLVLRLTPGIPYALQNITLGVLGMRIVPYLLVSLPTTSLWMVSFVVTGGALFEGDAVLFFGGFGLLLALVLATRIVQSKTRDHV
jgi:uncharacterized membrane protein YdjX (TVP38/TMEM64 family)